MASVSSTLGERAPPLQRTLQAARKACTALECSCLWGTFLECGEILRNERRVDEKRRKRERERRKKERESERARENKKNYL